MKVAGGRNSILSISYFHIFTVLSTFRQISNFCSALKIKRALTRKHMISKSTGSTNLLCLVCLDRFPYSHILIKTSKNVPSLRLVSSHQLHSGDWINQSINQVGIFLKIQGKCLKETLIKVAWIITPIICIDSEEDQRNTYDWGLTLTKISQCPDVFAFVSNDRKLGNK